MKKVRKAMVSEEEKASYVPPVSLKETVAKEATAKGYQCELNLNSVVMFIGRTSDDDREIVRKWLFDTYAKEEIVTQAGKETAVKRIPFSYGFE